MERLHDRRVLITGAAGGLGAAISRALAREGARLALSGRDQFALERLRGDLVAGGATAEMVVGDLCDRDQVSGLPGRAEEALGGPIDVLVNNAGLELTSVFAGQPPEELERIIQVNLAAPMLLTRAVLPGMLERRCGHVVQIASIAGKHGAACIGPYAATKSGLVGLTQGLRAELRGSGVGCSVVCPGFTTGDGMYARQQQEGHSAPCALGALPAVRVAEAVLDAIHRDRPEVVVNQRPLRPLLALAAVAPGVAEGILERVGANAYFRRVAAGRGRG
jgi:short-subunit dehydrogenase